MIERYLPDISETGWRWLRFALLLAVIAALSTLLYSLRSVFTPVLIAAACAYILNPVVTWMERRFKLDRLYVVLIVFTVFALVVVAGGIYLSVLTLGQLAQLQHNLPDYAGRLFRFVQENAPQLVRRLPATTTAPTSAPTEFDWAGYFLPLVQRHGLPVAQATAQGVLAALSNLFAVAAMLVLSPLFTFFFLWRFDEMVGAVRAHLPHEYRATIVTGVATVDAAMASFFRGRLIVCLLIGLSSALGWSLVGVPYALPLGLLAGVLNLVPFMSILALPPVVILAAMPAYEAHTSWAYPVMFAMGVYLAVQALESFVFSPLIEGQASGLHPLVIVLAISIGAELAGLLGMLLAIPIASTLKTFARTLVLPELRRLAEGPAPPAPPDEPATPAAPDDPRAGPPPA